MVSSRTVVAEGAFGVAPALAPAQAADDYLGRLVKYIPAEIVAFYVAAAGVMSPAGSPVNTTGLWVAFGLGFALVPIYFYIVTTQARQKPLWSQIILACIAYPAWVFAMGGPFASFGWYRNSVASLYKPEAGR